MKNIVYSFLVIFALFLTGCADAGKNQTVSAGDTVTLDASASTASNGGEIKKYIWKQISGPHITLSDKQNIQPTFTAPSVEDDTTLLFKLKTIEYGGKLNYLPSWDYVKILVKPSTSEVDTQAPTIILNGDAQVELYIGDTYTEKGATATDNVDDTVKVTISGKVDTQKIGTYIITYTATDTAGNIATKERIITVVLPPDTEAPVITLNGDAHISLMQGEVYNELGATATDNRDGTVKVTITGSVDTVTPGNYTITYSAVDAAGNTATETRSIIVEEKPVGQCINAKFVLTNPDIFNGIVEYEIQFYTAPTEDINIELSTDFTIISPFGSEKATPTNQSELSVVISAGTKLYTGLVSFQIPNIDPVDTSGYALRMENPLCDDTTKPTIDLHGGDLTLTIGDIYTETATAYDDRDGNITANLVITGDTVDTNNTGVYTVIYNVSDASGNAAEELKRMVTIIENQTDGYTLNGYITDINGTAIADALVAIDKTLTHTDNNGSYTLPNIIAGKRVSINVTHPQYLENSRIIQITMDHIRQDITLTKPKIRRTFNSQDGIIIEDNNASVELPSNGYIDKNGDEYVGDVSVKMSYYSIGTHTGQKAFPGSYEGFDGNTSFHLPSSGFLNVQLTDTQGNPINLNGHAVATLTFPKYNDTSLPDVIPLWYYDKILGYWVHDGNATSQGLTYRGIVSHFTPWMTANMPPPVEKEGKAIIKVCAEDEYGNPFPLAGLILTASHGYVTWTGGSRRWTDENGLVSIDNIGINTPYTLTAIAYTNTGRVSTATYPDIIQPLANKEERVYGKCIVIKKDIDITTKPRKLIHVSGIYYRATDCNGNSEKVLNGDVVIYDSYGLFVGAGTTDGNGYFNISFYTNDSNYYRVGGASGFYLEENKFNYILGRIVVPMCT